MRREAREKGGGGEGGGALLAFWISGFFFQRALFILVLGLTENEEKWDFFGVSRSLLDMRFFSLSPWFGFTSSAGAFEIYLFFSFYCWFSRLLIFLAALIWGIFFGFSFALFPLFVDLDYGYM